LPRPGSGLFGLGPAVVKGDFQSNFPRILASTGEGLPHVILAASSNDDALEIDPRLSNEVGFLVVCEDGDLELVVVG
jgi:hypothetical protein